MVLPFIGYAYEFFGRKYVIITSLFTSITLSMLIPYTAPNYSLLVFVKSLTVVFGTIVDANPLIPDYIKSESRGKGVSISLLGSICGEVFAMTVLIGLTMDMDLDKSFLFVGLIMGSMSCLIPFIVRECVNKPSLELNNEATMTKC